MTITGNRLTGQARQGIAVRDGVTAATVTGNVVERTDTGIYVRDSVVEVRGNTIQDAAATASRWSATSAKSVVTYNVVAGVGPSALDTSRADGRMTIRENQTFAWHDTSSFWVKFRHYASPMTMLWSGIFLLILFSAIKGRRRIAAIRGRRSAVHPYEDKLPLPAVPPQELTRPVRGRARVPALADSSR